VIQPVLDIDVRYRVNFILKNNVKSFDPPPTTTLTLDLETAKNFMFTKMYNGLMMSQKCPPFDRLYYLPLQDRINDFVEKFPLKKAKKSRAKKNAAGELVLPLPDKSSFQLVDGQVWDFYCDDISESLSWGKTISNVLQTFELNKMLDEGINDNSTSNPTQPSSSSQTPQQTQQSPLQSQATTTTKQPSTGSSIDQGFVIISGTYGRLGHEKHSKDITVILRDLVKQQGGNKLVLAAGPKKETFGNPAEGKKKHLTIIFSCNGRMRRLTFKDNDPVNIDINS